MEWLDKIKDFPNLIQQEPRYGYLVVAGLLLIWLVGDICGWKGTYFPPGRKGSNLWKNIRGPRMRSVPTFKPKGKTTGTIINTAPIRN